MLKHDDKSFKFSSSEHELEKESHYDPALVVMVTNTNLSDIWFNFTTAASSLRRSSIPPIRGEFDSLSLSAVNPEGH